MNENQTTFTFEEVMQIFKKCECTETFSNNYTDGKDQMWLDLWSVFKEKLNEEEKERCNKELFMEGKTQ